MSQSVAHSAGKQSCPFCTYCLSTQRMRAPVPALQYVHSPEALMMCILEILPDTDLRKPQAQLSKEGAGQVGAAGQD